MALLLGSCCEYRNIGVEQIVRLKEFPSSKTLPKDDKPPQSPQQLFVYCSTPRAVLDHEVQGGLYGRPLYHNNVTKPKGWHSYYNIGWDPRVRRGDPLQIRRRREEEECAKIRRKLLQPRERSKTAKMTKAERHSRQQEPEVMIRNANTRFGRLQLSNLGPKKQDIFIVDPTEELDPDERCSRNRIGGPTPLPKAPASKKNMTSEACQVWPNDFTNFDQDVVPVLERLVGSVCYQARLEVLEEEELNALKKEKDIFEERKKAEEDEKERLKARLEKVAEEQRRQLELAESQAQEIRLGKYAFSNFAGVYVKYAVEVDDWEAIRKAIEEKFCKGYLNSGVERKLNRHYAGQQLLNEIIRRVAEEREAEYASHLWTSFFNGEEPQVKTYADDPMESSRVPPPTPGSQSDYYTSDEEQQLMSRMPGSYVNSKDNLGAATGDNRV